MFDSYFLKSYYFLKNKENKENMNNMFGSQFFCAKKHREHKKHKNKVSAQAPFFICFLFCFCLWFCFIDTQTQWG